MKMWFRFLLTAAFALAAFSAAAAGAIQVTADPPEFPAGGETLVTIAVTGDPQDVRLPDVPGAVWRRTISNEYSMTVDFGGRRTQKHVVTQPLSAAVPGEIVIPAFEVRFEDGTTARSRPVRIKVLAPGEVSALAPAGRIILPEGRRSFYVGEAIPVRLEFSIPEGMRARPSDFPRIYCDGAPKLPDLPKRLSPHPHFSKPVEGERETPDGVRRTLTFTTVMRFAAPGEFTIAATEPMEILVSTRNIRRATLAYPERKVRIVPPPPAPAGSSPLGIGGGLRVEAALSTVLARAGEPVELEIKLPGAGNFAEIAPPELSFPGFRVYPPEVKTSPDGEKSIRYALVPLAPGEHELAVSFAVFDPAAGKWNVFPAKPKLVVTGGTAAAPAATPVAPPSAPPAAARPAPPAAPAARPVGKPEFPPPPVRGKELSLPLARSGLIRGGIAFGALALAALGIELVRRRKNRRSPEEDARRRRVAELIRRVKAGDRVNRVLRDGGTAALARVLELPEDSAPGDVARRVDDPELRLLLEELERDEFAPEAARLNRPVSARARSKLVKLLKRALLFAAALTAFGASGAEDPRSASGCYELGVEYLRRNDLPRARLMLERAHRFAPRDRAIDSALASVEAELGAPPRRRNWRDFFRPDEYLTSAGILFGLALVGAAALRKRRRGAAFAVALALAALGASAAALAWSQHFAGAPYDTARAAVTAREAKLSSLPAAQGGHVLGVLDGGSFVVIVDERGSYVRVRGEKAEGWCPRSEVEKIFPER